MGHYKHLFYNYINLFYAYKDKILKTKKLNFYTRNSVDLYPLNLKNTNYN